VSWGSNPRSSVAFLSLSMAKHNRHWALVCGDWWRDGLTDLHSSLMFPHKRTLMFLCVTHANKSSRGIHTQSRINTHFVYIHVVQEETNSSQIIESFCSLQSRSSHSSRESNLTFTTYTVCKNTTSLWHSLGCCLAYHGQASRTNTHPKITCSLFKQDRKWGCNITGASYRPG
jgi:hypothetical protein